MNIISNLKTKLLPALLGLMLCAGNTSAMGPKAIKPVPKESFKEDAAYQKTRKNLHETLYNLLTSLPKEVIAIMVNYTLPRVYGASSATIKVSAYPINHIIVLSPTQIAFAMKGDDETDVVTFDLENKESRRLNNQNNPITSLTVAAPKTIAAGDDTGEIKLWDTETGELKHSFQTNQKSASTLARLSDDQLITPGSSDGSSISEWNTTNGTFTKQHFGAKNAIKALGVFQDQQVAALTNTSLIHTCNLSDSRFDQSLWIPAAQCIASIEPNTLAAGSGNFIEAAKTYVNEEFANVVTLVDSISGRVMATMHGHQYPVTCLAAIGKTGYILSASEDQTLKVWNPDVKQCAATIKLDYIPTCLVVLPDGKKAVVGNPEGWLFVIDLTFE